MNALPPKRRTAAATASSSAVIAAMGLILLSQRREGGGDWREFAGAAIIGIALVVAIAAFLKWRNDAKEGG